MMSTRILMFSVMAWSAWNLRLEAVSALQQRAFKLSSL
jgi:hypothetical protein